MQGHPMVPWCEAGEGDRGIVIGSVTFLTENPMAGERELYEALFLREEVPSYDKIPEEVKVQFKVVASLARSLTDGC